MLIGGIEAGGTKIVCAVGTTPNNIEAKTTFPTKSPSETLLEIKRFFSRYELNSIGVGSFGPIDLDKSSKTYGKILNTPKLNWRNYNLLEQLKEDYSIPVYINTDVNIACLSEYYQGAGKNVNSCLYITIGTGIGAGFVKNGEIYQGTSHPEMGHIYIPKHPKDSFNGSCPYHKSCLEGLGSGTSIKKRHGKTGEDLTKEGFVWELESYYLAHAIVNYSFILSPERIILGGGVMKQNNLYPLIRKKVSCLINNYVNNVNDMENFIMPPVLNDEQGVKGAIQLAINQREREGKSHLKHKTKQYF